MDIQKSRITAKDFFLELGAMVALYAGAIALINLLFRVINVASPQVNSYGGYPYYGGSPISLPVATLIVVFPLFLLLSWVIQKSFLVDPSLRENALRRWLVYITLFVAGGVVAGDLITLIYQFLDGQELTAGFLLKVLSIFVVAGSVFVYFLSDLRGKLTTQHRNIWRIFAGILVLGSIIAGFAVIGSPASQRAYRYDSERVQHLESIQWQVVNFFQQKGYIPSSLSELEDPISGFKAPVDPETGEPYEYTLVGQSAKAFELCATFKMSTPKYPNQNPRMMEKMPSSVGGLKGWPNNWEHEAGRQCFDRAIDADLYPVKPR